MGALGHLSNSYKGLIIGFGFVVGDCGEFKEAFCSGLDSDRKQGQLNGQLS